MRGLISLHAVDVSFFDSLIVPLAVGSKVNPESFLADARRMRATELEIEPYRRALLDLLARLDPPPAPEGGNLWTRVRSRLEQLDRKPDPQAARVSTKIDADLHLWGRPFLITEGSSDRVAALVEDYRTADGHGAVEALVLEQLVKADPALPHELELPELEAPAAEMSYRADLLDALKAIHDLAQAARAGESWGPATGRRERALDALPRELPWRAVELHARARPFWVARDVDGLDAICRAAALEPPACLAAPARLFRGAHEALPGLVERLGTDLEGPRSVGAFVDVADVPELLAFLAAQGTTIIRAASRHGEGPGCATLLRKLRECAEYAGRHGLAYLEASGIRPIAAPEEEMADA